MASIRLVTLMLKPFFAHALWVFVWLLDPYGGSLGSYLPIPLENEFLKISETWVGAF